MTYVEFAGRVRRRGIYDVLGFFGVRIEVEISIIPLGKPPFFDGGKVVCFWKLLWE